MARILAIIGSIAASRCARRAINASVPRLAASPSQGLPGLPTLRAFGSDSSFDAIGPTLLVELRREWLGPHQFADLGRANRIARPRAIPSPLELIRDRA